jgi:Fe-S-cluster containining protein
MTALGNVPCNGCRACCLNDMISLMPERGDLIWTYEYDVIATAAGPMAVLQCGETGECIYLGRDGCTIHDRAPAICRAFDCRDLYLSRPAPSTLRWSNRAWSRMRFSSQGANGSKRWTCRDDGRQHGYC